MVEVGVAGARYPWLQDSCRWPDRSVSDRRHTERITNGDRRLTATPPNRVNSSLGEAFAARPPRSSNFCCRSLTPPGQQQAAGSRQRLLRHYRSANTRQAFEDGGGGPVIISIWISSPSGRHDASAFRDHARRVHNVFAFHARQARSESLANVVGSGASARLRQAIGDEFLGDLQRIESHRPAGKHHTHHRDGIM